MNKIPSEKKDIFAKEPEMPTQHGPEGLRFDFNYGCRIYVPEREDKKNWNIKMLDFSTGNVLYETNLVSGFVTSTKKYFVNFRIEIRLDGEVVFSHDLDLKDKKVLIQVPVGTLGDAIAWFPYIHQFSQLQQAVITCGMSPIVIPLFQDTYPEIEFVPLEQLTTDGYYASYRLGLFFDDWDCTHQPVDFRYAGLNKTAAYILGVEPIEIKPKISITSSTRKIKEPYVCIGVQSSTQCKYWNHPGGWNKVVAWLKGRGYRVLCIDKDSFWGQGITWNYIPHGAEDFTGNIPLQQRAELLQHADFFVGLSSGLSWLAWAMDIPVVMISGFTHPNNEFHTPFRVINYHTCNSCWNDPKHIFDHYDFFWCPRHKGTDRAYECTRLITTEQVINVISRAADAKKRKVLKK